MSISITGHSKPLETMQGGSIFSYPVFGMRDSRHFLLKKGFRDVARRVVAMCSEFATWEFMREFITENWCQEAWVVDLPDRSRSLGPGRMVFRVQPVSSISELRASRPCIVDAVAEAQQQLPLHQFFYLEPMWKQPLWLHQLVTPEELEQQEKREQHELRRQMTRWRWLHKLWPSFGRELRWLLYDPVIVAVKNDRHSDRPFRSEKKLLLIAHWD